MVPRRSVQDVGEWERDSGDDRDNDDRGGEAPTALCSEKPLELHDFLGE